MGPTLTSLGIDRLSVSEKLDLIEQIWDSLPTDLGPDDVPQWHLDELQKRLDRADAEPTPGTPWREVLDRLSGQP